MVLPIVAYGHPILRKTALEIGHDEPGIQELIANMFETMYATNGVGLAAPQVNRSLRLLILDASPFAKDFPELNGFKKVLVNPFILEESGESWVYNEGCLSIPDIHEDVERKSIVRVRYQDENFDTYEETITGIIGRIIQHEYDHLEGKLFVDHLSPIRKMLLKRRLNDISTGNIDCDYRMIYPRQKKGVR